MSLAKTAGHALGTARAAPYLVGRSLTAPLIGADKAFLGGSEKIARIPGMLGVYARQAYYRRVLQHVGRDVYFGFMSVFSKPQAHVGDEVYIGRFCSIGWAVLGDGVMLADGVQILSGRHQHGREAQAGQALRENEPRFSAVTIGAGAWLGANAVVMADVGENAVVGAGAVVVKPVPAGAKVGGVPARPLET